MQDIRQGNMINPAQLEKDFASGKAAIGVPFMIRPQDWVDNTIPFDNMFPSSQFDITLQLPDDATPEQKKAFEECRLEGSKISNTVKIGENGRKPDIEIPILVIVQKSQLSQLTNQLGEKNRREAEVSHMESEEKRIKEELGRISMLSPGIPKGTPGGIILPR